MSLVGAIRRDKYYLLLFTQLLFFGVLPIINTETTFGSYLIPLLLALILIAGINAVVAKVHYAWLAIITSIVFVLTVGATTFRTFPLLTLITFLLFVGLYIYVIYKIIVALLTTKEVKASLIAGALSGYLMIGVILSFFFLMLDAFDPHALSVSLDKNSYAQIIYFSLITLTTIGYGDIVPVNQIAQIFSAFGAIASQFYLAVVVAVIVGKMMNKNARK